MITKKTMTDEELKQLNAVYDCPDERDFLWEEYAEGLGDKVKFPGRQLKVRNQYSQGDTYKACSCYGLTVVFNGYQIIEFNKQGIEFEQENPRWKRQVFQAERGYPDRGASLQDMMKFFKNRKLIDGYTLAKTAQECKNAIKNGFGIYTGSSKCSWSKTNKSKQFVYDKDGANHCFSIVDYDDNGLRAINSFGETRGDNGYFYIPDENYKDLFSTYVIIDHDDTGKIDEMRYRMEYEEATKLGITNGTRPNEPVTRQETAVMIYRAMKKMRENI